MPLMLLLRHAMSYAGCADAYFDYFDDTRCRAMLLIAHMHSRYNSHVVTRHAMLLLMPLRTLFASLTLPMLTLMPPAPAGYADAAVMMPMLPLR